MSSSSTVWLLGAGVAAYLFRDQIGAALFGTAPAAAPPASQPVGINQQVGTSPCANGLTLDAAGVCTRYPDAQLVAQLNSIHWSGAQDIPAEQITRVDPQIIATYAGTKGVTPGSVLAYILGLGDNPQNGQTAIGTDGNTYIATNGVFVLTPRLQGVGGRKF